MLADTDIITAVNNAGFASAQSLQDGLSLVKSFADALEAAAIASGKTVPQLASAFAGQSVLQMQAVSIQAQIANAQTARDTATTTANAGISTMQAQLNATNAALAAAIAAANPSA